MVSNIRRCRKRSAEDIDQDNQGTFKAFKLVRRTRLQPMDPGIWEVPANFVTGNSQPAIQVVPVQQQQQWQQQQLFTAYADRILQHADCSPPVPESLPVAPPLMMETEAPTADQDPPTGYPSPATSGASSDVNATGHHSEIRACQYDANGCNSLFNGGCGLSLGAEDVFATGAVFSSSPYSLAIAQSLCQQYQQLQAWQQQQQQQYHPQYQQQQQYHPQYQQQQQYHPQYQQQQQEESALQVSNGAIGHRSTSDEGCNSGQSYNCYRSSPVPSQDPPTGYPTPCASSNDSAESPSNAGGTLLKSHSNAWGDEDGRGSSSGGRFQQRSDDASQAIADFGAARRQRQHECSCHNTPVPSQDPPSEYSESEDDACSFAGRGSGSHSTGHDVTAPPSAVPSQQATPAGSQDKDGMNGSYADDAVILGAPPSPVPSQDAPSEYPDPATPASSAEESEAECSTESCDMSSEPLPPGVGMAETYAAGISAGQLSSGISHVSFHEPACRQMLKSDGLTGGQRDNQQSWWGNLEEQRPFDCVWDDDYESGDSSVGSPCRH